MRRGRGGPSPSRPSGLGRLAGGRLGAHRREPAARVGDPALDQVEERLLDRARDRPALAVADQFEADKLYDIEGELIQYRAKSSQDTINYPAKLNSELAALAGSISGAEGRPTMQSYTVFEELSGRVDEQLARLNTLVEQDVAAFNQKVRDSGAPPISV